MVREDVIGDKYVIYVSASTPFQKSLSYIEQLLEQERNKDVEDRTVVTLIGLNKATGTAVTLVEIIKRKYPEMITTSMIGRVENESVDDDKTNSEQPSRITTSSGDKVKISYALQITLAFP